jgi:acetylornithine deacetylase
VPYVICGPADIAQAHTPDERIELSQIEACAQFLTRLLDHARTD